MKGNQDVIKALNALLGDEYGAAIQYGTHAERWENLGFAEAAAVVRKRQASEQEHARELTARIVFLEGAPVSAATGVGLATEPATMLDADLASELRARNAYANAIKLCHDRGDPGTRVLLEHILAEEEEHVNYIEGQKALVKATAGNSGLLALIPEAGD